MAFHLFAVWSAAADVVLVFMLGVRKAESLDLMLGASKADQTFALGLLHAA